MWPHQPLNSPNPSDLGAQEGSDWVFLISKYPLIFSSSVHQFKKKIAVDSNLNVLHTLQVAEMLPFILRRILIICSLKNLTWLTVDQR